MASTPVNTLSRDDIVLLIRNNVLNHSVEFPSDADEMETDSPVRPANYVPARKKLFHSPTLSRSPGASARPKADRSKKRKRNEMLLPGSECHTTTAFLREAGGHSPNASRGVKKRNLLSLFHGDKYSMDIE